MADLEHTGAQVRRRFRDLEPNSVDQDNKAYAEYISLGPATPLGHTSMTINSTAQPLPDVPEQAKRAVLYCINSDFTWTDDGSTPSGSHGMPMHGNAHFIYDTEPVTALQVWAEGDADCRIAYYA